MFMHFNKIYINSFRLIYNQKADLVFSNVNLITLKLG